jgi:hypothetical protein
MFHECLPGQPANVAKIVNSVIGDAIFSYVTMVCIMAVTEKSSKIKGVHIEKVETLLTSLAAKRKMSQKGGNGIPWTGIGSHAYSPSNGTGVQASAALVNGVIRPAHMTSGTWLAQGGASANVCKAIESAIKKEVKLILKDQEMRAESGAVSEIVQKIEVHIGNFLHILKSETKLSVSDIKKASKAAFRDIKIIIPK